MSLRVSDVIWLLSNLIPSVKLTGRYPVIAALIFQPTLIDFLSFNSLYFSCTLQIVKVTSGSQPILSASEPT